MDLSQSERNEQGIYQIYRCLWLVGKRTSLTASGQLASERVQAGNKQAPHYVYEYRHTKSVKPNMLN